MGDKVWLPGYTPSEDGNHLWLEVMYTSPIANDDLLTIEASVEGLFREWFRHWIDHAGPTDNDIIAVRTARENLAISLAVQAPGLAEAASRCGRRDRPDCRFGVDQQRG